MYVDIEIAKNGIYITRDMADKANIRHSKTLLLPLKI
jgi:hypothetical protein